MIDGLHVLCVVYRIYGSFLSFPAEGLGWQPEACNEQGRGSVVQYILVCLIHALFLSRGCSSVVNQLGSRCSNGSND